MKIALIPPKGYERWALHSNFHLALAQITNYLYIETYVEASKRGDYVVIDNGANEGVPVGDLYLLHQARKFHADEIVAPDVLRDGVATVRRTQQFFRNAKEVGQEYKGYNYMAVAQGRSIVEVQDCIFDLAQIEYITCIGLPRHLLTTLSNATTRLFLADWINKEYGNKFEIHFLGVDAQRLPEISAAAQKLYVRSVDSSVPFNYAYRNEALPVAGTDVSAIDRRSDYFSQFDAISPSLLRHNITLFKALANAK